MNNEWAQEAEECEEQNTEDESVVTGAVVITYLLTFVDLSTTVGRSSSSNRRDPEILE